MSRYIDADEAKEVICKHENRNIQKQMIYAIERIPDADVTNVVRCKDCKYLYIKDFVYGTCNHNQGLNGIIQPDDFCSHGEKSNVQNTHIPNTDIKPDYADLHDKFIGRKRG